MILSVCLALVRSEEPGARRLAADEKDACMASKRYWNGMSKQCVDACPDGLEPTTDDTYVCLTCPPV